MHFRSSLLGLLIAFGLVSAPIAPAIAAPSGGDSTASTAPISSWTAETVECDFLKLINDYRVSKGLGALTISLTLGAAAEHHSIDMAEHNYFSHTLYDGTSWSKNIANHGYPTDTSRAENIAAGKPSAADVFAQWKGSSGHNANMLSSKFNAIGIGRYKKDGSTYTYYWTTTFGSRVDKPYTCSGQSSGGGEAKGTQLTITGGGRTSSSTASTLAYDGNTATSWYTTAKSAPAAAYVYFDLGASKSIGQIQWYFSKSGSADSYEIQISTNKTTWTKVSTKSNAKSGAWQTLKLSKKARYVRFYFENPNKDKVLGYLGEVKIYS